MSRVHIVAAGLVVLAGALLASRRADACTCSSRWASVLWPPADRPALTDTTLIVARSRGGSFAYQLTDDAGSAVPLQTVRTLEATEGCTRLDHVILKPGAPLPPARRFSFAIAGDFPPGSTPAAHTFETGTATRPLRPPAMTFSLFAQDVGDRRLLQVFVTAQGGDPVLVRAVGEKATIVTGFGKGGPPTLPSEPFGIALGSVPCAAVEVVDLQGRTVRDERLCTPRKCERTDAIGGDSCGNNWGGDTWAHWQTIPDGCGAAVADAGAAPMAGAPAAAPAADDTQDGAGCSAAPAAPPGTGALLLAAAILLGRRRRS